ncbi:MULTISPECIES: ParD-like family protein [Providencia]|uniref:ParD-like family protein n=1 Tax=Providencia TaxID=586 RepID=UPI001C5B8B3F|nr:MULTISPECIES: ParD-like family protein [Providencia]ELR5151130.1 ParD-like family protein [Providencia rettgeri]QXX84995.1 ParD-like family protein [Providencia sp. R33]
MGIVKISDELHDYLRHASQVMSRSINSQAEFWIKIGIQAELNPDKTFTMLINEMLEKELSEAKGKVHD